jgi:adenosylcobinamide-GDP ribazoletransferase
MTGTHSHPLRDFALAISTLSVLPVRVSWPKGEPTDTPGYYPLVGVLLGVVWFGFARLAWWAGFAQRAPLVVAGLVVAIGALATRGLHWDGLADVADAFGVFDPARRLEVMRDSSVGAFGVTAIVLCAVIQSAAVAHVLAPGRSWALLAVPALARFAATCAAWFGKPARPDGLGASVIGKPRIGAILPVALVLGTLASLAFTAAGPSGIALVVAGVALALVVPHLLALRVGGVTGDVMGASVVVVETLLFAVLAVLP